ncbi:hypothetical protein [Paenibacillus amylolyticus]|uniref:hypothetical protein n=1 Tax=Paenibacillus TaxID=44249 RepID=UPI00249A6FCF|nr:hypothetical protein [Paenibacillus amylolyticus]WFA82699.1 hypothetical protein OGI70_16700 [Paenibacillus amylolyticus]
MKYFDYLRTYKEDIVKRLESSIHEYKVQPVGNGYIDCIVMKDNLRKFVKDLSTIGIFVSDVTWWCYVNPNNESSECPHGMGGPVSEYYEGWFSELQNESYEVNKKETVSIMKNHDTQLIYSINDKTLDKIDTILKVPFCYTPTEYIEANKCVIPAVCLTVPDEWKR